jgi:hypothetical protein
MRQCGMLEGYNALVILKDKFQHGQIDIIGYVETVNEILDEMDEDFMDNCPAVRPDPMM